MCNQRPNDIIRLISCLIVNIYFCTISKMNREKKIIIIIRKGGSGVAFPQPLI